MYMFALADRLLRLLFPLALCLTVYLYLYPVFHGCVFPATDASTWTAWTDTFDSHWPLWHRLGIVDPRPPAPFRLLVFADPQLEGDSSLPRPEDGFRAKLERHRANIVAWRWDYKELPSLLLETAWTICRDDIPEALQAGRKRLDLLGNDFYLGHIYRTLHWWTTPSHVTVLGDLIGSQWVTDEEFAGRSWRFWNRVFADGRRVDDAVTSPVDGRPAELDMGDGRWTNTIINIAGNHDVGYAGDISSSRMDRFERSFGMANWDVKFLYPQNDSAMRTHHAKHTRPSLHLVVLNSLILDGPALSQDLQDETLAYIRGLIADRLPPVEDQAAFTLLLTHLPLHKPEGTCVDAPFMDYWGDDDGGGVYKPHGLKEQNHLSEHATHRGTLQALYGMSGNTDAVAKGKGRNGLILTGHDHEGCDVWHYVPANSTWTRSTARDDAGLDRQTTWAVAASSQTSRLDAHTRIREVTLRSMMGDYGGNAGLLSAWFDFAAGEWTYSFHTCGLSVKIWWIVHVVDLIVGVLMVLSSARRWSAPSLLLTQRHAAATATMPTAPSKRDS